MISYSEITKLFSFDLEGKWCIEIEFSVKGYPKYQSCWMGKTPNKKDKEKELYWYGLVPNHTTAIILKISHLHRYLKENL